MENKLQAKKHLLKLKKAFK